MKNRYLVAAVMATSIMVFGGLTVIPNLSDASRTVEPSRQELGDDQEQFSGAQLSRWRQMRGQLSGVGPEKAVAIANDLRSQDPNVWTTLTTEAVEVIMAETLSTGDNGFFELWLPRNETFNVTVSNSLGKATRAVSTASDAPTCITDMQLM